VERRNEVHNVRRDGHPASGRAQSFHQPDERFSERSIVLGDAGCIEISTAALISPALCFSQSFRIGSVLAMGLFVTTLSMVVTTPGWEPTLGFPALSAMPGQFLLKTS
jgi:uncharacterized membrane protein YkgB